MRSRFVPVLLTLGAFASSSATSSFADPIVIGGSIQYERKQEGFLDLAAPGFSAFASFGLEPGPPGNCSPCNTGELFNPGGTENFGDLGGELVVNGKVFSLVGGRATFTAASLRVPELVPGAEPGEAFGGTSGPFRFAGFFEGEDALGERIRVDVLGTGIVSVGFDRFGDGPIGWAHSFYNMAPPSPIPEPTTLTLLAAGAGLVGTTRVAARRKRHRA